MRHLQKTLGIPQAREWVHIGLDPKKLSAEDLKRFHQPFECPRPIAGVEEEIARRIREEMPLTTRVLDTRDQTKWVRDGSAWGSGLVASAAAFRFCRLPLIVLSGIVTSAAVFLTWRAFGNKYLYGYSARDEILASLSHRAARNDLYVARELNGGVLPPRKQPGDTEVEPIYDVLLQQRYSWEQ
jgi:hypothetical protein